MEIMSFRMQSYICILGEESETLNNLVKKLEISDVMLG